MPTSAESQATQPAAAAASPNDPFRYGWRYVRHERPDGSYAIEVDAVTTRRQPGVRLLGYRLQEGIYQPLPPNEHGRLWLEPVRLWLGTIADEIVCYDEAGQPLGNYAELRAALEAETQARAEAEARAQAAETRLHELEAQLRQMRGE